MTTAPVIKVFYTLDEKTEVSTLAKLMEGETTSDCAIRVAKAAGSKCFPTFTVIPVRTLTCACCGASAPGRQWWNRDTGYGVCAKCFTWISGREGAEQAEQSYGKPGIHHSLNEKE